MKVLNRFLAFTSALPSDQLESVEEALAARMESFSAEFAFAPHELAEIDRRIADPNPEYASAEDINKLFGKPFAA